ncbi:MAG TPA: hypothetical protein VKF40_06265 [Burkholderiales bacterium]|nr:hypothetical protein [Burkholderiales bacterium]
MLSKHIVTTGILILGLAGMASKDAFALRPYDSTDADVAGAGEFELEFGPVGYLRDGANKYWVAPAVIANIGLEGGRELVLQGQRLQLREGEPGTPATSFVNNGAFIKQVLRRGALQDESGPSVATEYGLLLPGVNAENGVGFSWAGIVSQRWPAATVHLNGALALTREHRGDVFLGAIIEGPYDWPVRPVMEVFTEKTSGSPRTVSRLVGAIWRSKEHLSFDIGIRSANEGDRHVREVRLGLTWAFPLRKSP